MVENNQDESSTSAILSLLQNTVETIQGVVEQLSAHSALEVRNTFPQKSADIYFVVQDYT